MLYFDWYIGLGRLMGMNKRDSAFIIIILAIALLSYVFMNASGNKDGDMVVVTVDGNPYGSYKLDEDKEIEVKNEHGYNIISINDGQVSMENADCPDKYCVKQGPISKSNESIICLPHKLVVEIAGDDNEIGDIDSVAK